MRDESVRKKYVVYDRRPRQDAVRERVSKVVCKISEVFLSKTRILLGPTTQDRQRQSDVNRHQPRLHDRKLQIFSKYRNKT